MEILKEVTDWDTPNHIYLLDRGALVAYIRAGTTEPIWFSTPLKQFSKSRRKFVKLDYDPFNVTKQDNIVEVKGSKGQTYQVNTDTGECTCVGFQFRGKCKHIQALIGE